jgi:hypothetical protein
VSQVSEQVVRCTECQHEQPARLFDSVNGERIPAQAVDILAGTFEQQECQSCGAVFRPEHPMLYSELTTRTWIVMHPPADRARFALIERGVFLVMERAFASAPPAVSEAMRGVRPRLVFGQAMLTEALRVLRAGVSPALLECAKLLALRRNLAALTAYGESQLLFEQHEEDGRMRCGVVAMESGRRLGELMLPADAIAEARASQAQLEGLYPELFGRPYVSACRYLLG